MTRELENTGLDDEQLLALVYETVKALQWKITMLNEAGIVATPEDGLVFICRKDNLHQINCNFSGDVRADDELRALMILAAFEERFVILSKVNSAKGLTEIFRKIIPVSSEKEALAEESPMAIFLGAFNLKGDYFATLVLIGLNLLLFIAMVFSGIGFFDFDIDHLLNWGANYRYLTLDGQWWRLLTCTFIHDGFIHLLLNMYALLFVCNYLENIIGRVNLIAGYIITGIAASSASLWYNVNVVSIGASGAVFGLYGIFFALLLTNLIDKQARTSLLVSIGIFIVYNLAGGMKEGIDNAAHIGGLLAGIITGLLFYPALINPDNRLLQLVSLIVPASLVLGLSVYLLSVLSNPMKVYYDNMDAFSRNEYASVNALKKYKTISNSDYLMLINDSSLQLWKKNIQLLAEIETENLPDELKYHNELLKQYAQLRVDESSWLYIAVKEQTNAYDQKIDSIQQKITAVLKKINKE